jgi:hypothetical protein
LGSALVLDMRSASESLVCADAVTTKTIHRVDRIICEMDRDFAIWKELAIDFRGRTISGSYSTSREGLVSVKTLRGSKTTTLGGSNPRLVARILLRELAAEGKA